MPAKDVSIRPVTENRRRFRFGGEIADDIILELQLMGLALATGIMDATTFPDYHVFVSNQTGNTALLAVGALNIGGDLVKLQNVGVSLGLFIAGGMILGQMGNALGPRRRLWLLFTNLLQTTLVCVATGLRWKCATHDGTPGSLVVLSLLAFASGGQIAVARTVNVPEITTGMVTSAYIDLLVDPHIFAVENRSRNRRFFFICNLLLGSFIGATAYHYVGASLSLLLSAICKSIITMALFTNSDVSVRGTDSKENKCTVFSMAADGILRSVTADRISDNSFRSVKSAPP
ncbi:uncharacterized protein N7498_002005 [Penicillium cinerascens]|uniref:DUF1275 domain protein n=1 Tax=Penicillium cinerascens TaxID=70096 RepID=A0A9W9TAH0_9EURO|nr:uncharacterized protein N7498_002005 [Penicillium cinerascens]KAJ5215598.1 hypothetical protein N7498_002005 [Penicillium cinerascens]